MQQKGLHLQNALWTLNYSPQIRALRGHTVQLSCFADGKLQPRVKMQILQDYVLSFHKICAKLDFS